jgi:two-component system, cell cycle response regulator
LSETRITQSMVRPPVAPAEEKPCLVQLLGPSLGRKFAIDADEFDIGRDESCAIVLDLDDVSRKHCRLALRKGDVFVFDHGSTNGTFLNGAQIQAETQLRSGDLIKVGACIFKFLAVDECGAIEAQYHEEIYRLTVVDGLTQLFNKRYALDFLDREASRASRHRRPLALVLFDVDHFKAINDARGHSAGDSALRELSMLMKKRVRREECLARWGGEEFALILPEADEGQGRFVAEALRKLVSEHRFGLGEPLHVTVSAGVSAFHEGMTLPEGDPKHRDRDLKVREGVAAMIDAADRALYEAKRKGRNQVSSATL